MPLSGASDTATGSSRRGPTAAAAECSPPSTSPNAGRSDPSASSTTPTTPPRPPSSTAATTSSAPPSSPLLQRAGSACTHDRSATNKNGLASSKPGNITLCSAAAGEVQWRRREAGDQRHGVPPAAAALAHAQRAHRRRPALRHGAAPGARVRGEQGRRDRRPLQVRRPRPVPEDAGARHQEHQGHPGQGGARRGGRPQRRAGPRQRVLPLHGLPDAAALLRGGSLDCLPEASPRGQVPGGASQGCGG
ncbi:hypothetical protein PVAP13_6KG314500 [Panicum virgatum]|uniref:Uncharacterized protein n=1 Tax=Panicum virgatum TaxID=38727 RepID=A0A8T0RFC0_PANVG|nr:hypothetical protein PVAP13_6KG314500 [Panicum virgatum]